MDEGDRSDDLLQLKVKLCLYFFFNYLHRFEERSRWSRRNSSNDPVLEERCITWWGNSVLLYGTKYMYVLSIVYWENSTKEDVITCVMHLGTKMYKIPHSERFQIRPALPLQSHYFVLKNSVRILVWKSMYVYAHIQQCMLLYDSFIHSCQPSIA